MRCCIHSLFKKLCYFHNLSGAGRIEYTATNGKPERRAEIKVFLAAIAIHQPDIVLLGEPSNHLDTAGRQLLYDFIKTSPSTLLVVSHNRKLLDLLDSVTELSKRGIAIYGSHYEFYAEHKQVESNALNQDVKSREKTLHKARETEREALKRKQKLDACDKNTQYKASLPTILRNVMRNSAENSSARIKSMYAEKVGAS